MLKVIVALLLGLQAGPTPVPTPAPTPPVTVRVALDTAEGRIVLELDKTHAPITTANFLKYVDQRRLDGIGFYRTAKGGPAFCTPNCTKPNAGPPLAVR